MTKVQKIQLKMSELRERVNTEKYMEIRSDASDAEQRIGERNTLTEQLSALESEFRAALEAEDTPESREWAGMSARFDLGELFGNVMEHRVSSGAIAEVQQQRGLGANALPTELLMEHRGVTEAPANVGQTQGQIEGYVFPRSIAAFLGIPSPIVPVGDATFPVLTSDPAAGTPAENDPQTESDGTFAANLLSPSRGFRRHSSGVVRMPRG